MKILVLQLARLGDILQTLPALQGLKHKYPNSHITLVVRSTFADSARLSPHVDKVVEFPTTDILGEVIAKPEKATAQKALKKLTRWVAEDAIGLKNAKAPYDLLLNLTFTKASSYLAALIPAKEKSGLVNGVMSDTWSQYFTAHVLGNTLNVIHLNDYFSRIARARMKTWPLEINTPKSPVRCEPVRAGKTRIGVQLTASRSEKTLNLASWKTLYKTLAALNPHYEFVFFGAADDQEVISKVMAEVPAERSRSLAGKMRFHENLAWVRSCRWIVTPDTAIVHLASLGAADQGTKIIQISIGDVRAEETGPYGEGHRILYPISSNVEDIGEQIHHIISGKPVTKRTACAATRMVRCADGSLRSELYPLNFDPPEVVNFFSQSFYLLSEFRCEGAQEDIPVPVLGNPAQPESVDQMTLCYDALCTTRRLAEYGSHYCFEMLKNIDDSTELKRFAAKITEVEELLAELQKTVPILKPLIDTWKVTKELSALPVGVPDRLESLVALTEGTYRELGQNVEIIQQLLQVAVDAAQAKQAKRSSKEVPKEAVSKDKE